MQPNVLLIVLDTARADAFEPYGAPPGTTPTVAELAARGSAQVAYSTANWTVPAHASLFTGSMPRALGLTQVSGGDRRLCREPLRSALDHNVVRVLQQAGWATRGVSANPWISADSGFDGGFDEFVTVPAPRRARMHDRSVQGRFRWAVDALVAGADHGARRVEEVVRRWINEADQPFFWFVNLLECHSPYLPPKPYNDLRPWRRLQVAQEARRYLTLDSVFRVCSGNMNIPVAATQRMAHLYRRAVTMMDDWLRRVLDEMARYGLLADTQVIVTSDHGENLGESGLIGHAFSLDNRLLRVPFVTAGPLPLSAGGVSSLASFPSRLATALDLNADRWHPDEGLVVAEHDGVAEPESAEMQRVARDWRLTSSDVHRLARSLTAATDGRWKVLSEHGGENVAFDLSADPLELDPKPLGNLPEEVRDRLVSAVQRQQSEGAGRKSGRATVSDPDARQDTAALEEQMRLLGYL